MPNTHYKPQSLLHINSTGNTFLVDETPFLNPFSKVEVNIFWKKTTIQTACRKHKVDGLAILFTTPDHHLEWQFFNADGSNADMCGNLARGLVYYLSKKHPKLQEPFYLLGPNNIIQKGYLKNNTAFLSMPEGKKISDIGSASLQNIYSSTQLKKIPSYYQDAVYISLGVPHALIPIYPEELSLSKIFQEFFNQGINSAKKILDFSLYKVENLPSNLQKIIQKHRQKNFQEFNVTLFNPNTLKTISFERGVENFTLSCGTGASALAYYLKTFIPTYANSREIIISMPGGELFINVEKKEYLLGGKCRILSLSSI